MLEHYFSIPMGDVLLDNVVITGQFDALKTQPEASENLQAHAEDVRVIFSDVDHTNIENKIADLYDQNKVVDTGKMSKAERFIMDQQATAIALYGVAHSPMTGKGLNADRYFDALIRKTYTKAVEVGIAEYIVPENEKDMVGSRKIEGRELKTLLKKDLLDIRYVQWKDEYISTHTDENGSITKRMLAKNGMPMVMLHTRGNGSITEDAAIIGKSEFMKQETFDLDFYRWLAQYGALLRASSMQKRIDEVTRIQPPYAAAAREPEEVLSKLTQTQDSEEFKNLAKQLTGDAVLFDPSEGKANIAIDFVKILADTEEGQELRRAWSDAWTKAANKDRAPDKELVEHIVETKEDVMTAMNEITRGRVFDWMPSVANNYVYFDFAPKGVNKGSRSLYLIEYVKDVYRQHGVSTEFKTVGIGDNFSGNDADFYGAVDYSVTNDPDRAPSKQEMPDLIIWPGANRMDRTLKFWQMINRAHAKKQMMLQ